MRRASSATLEFTEVTLVMLSFHVLFMRNPAPACPLLASEWYSRWPFWRVVKLSYFLRNYSSPITSYFMLFSFSSSSSSCTFAPLSNVLALCVAIFSRSPCVVVLLEIGVPSLVNAVVLSTLPLPVLLLTPEQGVWSLEHQA